MAFKYNTESLMFIDVREGGMEEGYWAVSGSIMTDITCDKNYVV